ncbi:conjugal transfer protein TraG N-terminal domain-containing protein [Simkania negevensis]|uniref:Conjugal transfer mating pair stabilisation protein TraG n=1 Tax=Simkania negevensis (strain ATCC VR-1471 / DSM 27360 / Z) TaxID=331113 RepID=F8L2X7_SIMNZ|nr:conjugal transfer protein TraG N-terminal domain-containing protein [Simkania negevensis]CCB87823.1 conjugal transfer mating pair stabilisation protein TraG [Simkania negevensis Z]
MKKLFLALLFLPVSLYSEETFWPIFTWGNGRLTKSILDALTALSKSSEYNGYILLCVFIGLNAALLYFVVKGSIFAALRSWLVPTLILLNIGFIPVKVVIHDNLVKTDPIAQNIPVDNVPLFFAAPMSIFTSFSQEMTEIMETFFHQVNDPIYNWTGHIFGGHSLYNIRKMKILDGTTEQNFREFCRECVFRDLGLGIYTREDLLEAPNLIKFLKNHTSKIRGCTYIYPKTLKINVPKNNEEEVSDNKIEATINDIASLAGTKGRLSCRRAIEQIAMNISGNLLNSREILLGAVGNQFGFLSKTASEAPIEEIIKQQIAIDTLKDYTNPTHTSLAAAKARAVQNETNRILGIFSSADLIAQRNDLFLILLAASSFIGILSLMQIGLKMILNYFKLLAWLAFWPPLYVVVNFLLDHKWAIKKTLYGISNSGLTLGTSEGLLEIWQQQQASANALLCMIPALSWAILFLAKQGVHALFSMVGGLSGGAHSAASAGAAEAVSGNYNYQNIGIKGKSTGHSSFFQQQNAPFIGTDKMTQSMASGEVVSGMTGEGLTYKEAQSNLANVPVLRESLSSSISNQLEEAESLNQTDGIHLSETASDLTSALKDLGFTRNTSLGQTEGHTSTHQQGLHTQAQQAYSQALSLAEQRGESVQDVFREAANANLGFKVFGTGTSGDLSLSKGFSHLSDEQKQTRLAEDLSLFKQLQNLSQTAKTDGVNLSGASDVKTAQNFTDKFDKMGSVAESYNSSFSKIQGLKDLQSVAQSKDLSVSNSLVNPFTDYLFDRNHQDIGRVQSALRNPEQMESYANDFLSDYKREFEMTKPDLEAAHIQNKDSAIHSFNDPSQRKFSVHENVAPDMHINSEFKKDDFPSKNLLKTAESQIGSMNPGIIQIQDPGDWKPLELTKARKNAPTPLDIRDFKHIESETKDIPQQLDQKNEEFEKNADTHFLLKSIQHSTVKKAAGMVQKFFELSESELSKPYDPGLPGWDELTGEQKVAVMDFRTSDDI